jgi:antitoxin (DNA-binding transcriptional repressor) of toxin-antitoxin stability system
MITRRVASAHNVRENEGVAIVVTLNGRPVAVLLGVQDDDEVERLIMSHSRRLRDILDEAHKRIRAGEGISHEDFWKQVDAEHAEPPAPEKPQPKSRGRKPRKS